MFKKTCKNCRQSFAITDDDQAFYNKIDVPEPTWCPECRFLRRVIHRNEKTFYSRQCDLCNKKIISIYNKNQKFPVYCPVCWYSDKWDPRNYGHPFNFSEPFFPQFCRLREIVPRLSMMQFEAINSDYSNMCGYGKNYYLAASTIYSEDIYYSKNIDSSAMCIDCLDCNKSEILYECFLCSKCYSLAYCFDCQNCNYCNFCLDCRGCSSCFGCYNLRNKSYCFFNKQLTEDEYRRELAKINIGSHQRRLAILNQFLKVTKSEAKYRFSHIFDCVDSTGDYMTNCKNVNDSYFVHESEDCKYTDRIPKLGKDCMDVYAGGEGQLQYEGAGGVRGYNCLFNYLATEGKFLCYTDFCISGSYLFGCVSAHHQKYCVLNKQYTEEEYNNLTSKIIDHMKKTGEWGEYFPPESTLFGYNETIAMEFYPETREEILARGWRWQDDMPGSFGRETLVELPDDIKKVDDNIIKEILVCDNCNKNYKIIGPELNFYRQQNLALPRKCPDCRLFDRLKFRNPRHLHHRQCMNSGCANEFKTTYAPDRPERVYCEDCYRKEIY